MSEGEYADKAFADMTGILMPRDGWWGFQDHYLGMESRPIIRYEWDGKRNGLVIYFGSNSKKVEAEHANPETVRNICTSLHIVAHRCTSLHIEAGLSPYLRASQDDPALPK